MDVSGFLTFFAVIAALLALSSDEKKLEIAIKFKFKRWIIIGFSFLILSIYLLFYDLFSAWEWVFPYPWILGFDNKTALLLLCVISSIIFYSLIFNGSVRVSQVPLLLKALSTINQSEKKLEHIEYLLNKNINLIKKYIQQKSKTQRLIQKITTEKIDKKRNQVIFLPENKVLLGIREAAIFRFIIEPLCKYEPKHPDVLELIKRNLMTSKLKSYLFTNNPSLVLDLLFLINEPLTERDIEKLLEESSQFRFESESYFNEQYSYNSIADFSILLTKAIGNVDYLANNNFFESLEKINKNHLIKEVSQLKEQHEYIPNDSFLNNSFFNFYVECVKCSSMEIIKNKVGVGSKYPNWYLTQFIKNLIVITNETTSNDESTCEFESRAGYFIYQALRSQCEVLELANNEQSLNEYPDVIQSTGHSFYSIINGSNSKKVKEFAFTLLASSFHETQCNDMFLESFLYGTYGVGVKSSLLDLEKLEPLMQESGDDIYRQILSKNLTKKVRIFN
jgi:hypothetical protein